MKSKRQNSANVRIDWRDVWIGAALTSVLFTIGKFLIGLYLGHSAVTSTYGAAGLQITVLLWVYHSSLVFFWARTLPGFTPPSTVPELPPLSVPNRFRSKQEKVRRPNGEPETTNSRGIVLEEPPEKPDLRR